MFSLIQLIETPWTVACQAPLSMDFSMQEYWSGLSFPTVREHPDPGIKTESLEFPALAGWLFNTMPPGKPYLIVAAFKMSLGNPSYFGRATNFSVYI